VEIKSFPMLDGSADPAKVGAAARQSAVYVLALELEEEPEGDGHAGTSRRATPLTARPFGPPHGRPRDPGSRRQAPRPAHGAAVCPKDFSNLPTASAVDVRKQRSVTRRQLDRLTRIEDIADTLPEGTCFAPDLPTADLTAAVESVPAAYAPECLAACELAFHCRDHSRAEGAVTSLGRSLRAELGGLTTVDDVLAAARGETGDPATRRSRPAERRPCAEAGRRAAGGRGAGEGRAGRSLQRRADRPVPRHRDTPPDPFTPAPARDARNAPR
jgi:hypothetical protein